MKLQGIIGAILLVLGNVFLFLDIQPYEKFYFVFIWFGYVFFVDFLVYMRKGKSLISDKPRVIFGMFLMSTIFWKIFEYLNLRLANWNYTGTEFFGIYGDLFAVICFSTVIPAFFETFDLISDTDYEKIFGKKLSRKGMITSILVGIVMFILMMTYPEIFFSFEWIFLFLILDSINYYNNQPSVMRFFRHGKWKFMGQLVLSAFVLGFLWEFWNYWASVRWTYTLPFLEFFYIFEMPIFGYLGYIPFVFESFAFYYFVKYLFEN